MALNTLAQGVVSQALHAAVKAVAPMLSVQIGDFSDKTTWKVLFVAPTAIQQVNAQNAINAFDITTVPLPPGASINIVPVPPAEP